MANFTKSTFEYNGQTYNRYQDDRKRGGASWVFFNVVPVSATYDPTWPKMIEQCTALSDVKFVSRIMGDDIYVDFIDTLTTVQEVELENLYDSHVAPVYD